MAENNQQPTNNSGNDNRLSVDDAWEELRKFTQARIGQGRVGCSLPSHHQLKFNLDHAMARDAINTPIDMCKIEQELARIGINSIQLHSKAEDRRQYLQRPDLGRALNKQSVAKLKHHASTTTKKYDISLVLVDGLSSTGVQQNGTELCQSIIDKLAAQNLSVSPVCLVEQGRVAIGDEVGFLLKAKSTVLIVGERPGLSSPDSLGIYYTYNPKVGLNDAGRNCISNIRPAGLPFSAASEKLLYLIQESFARKLSGVKLKDNAVSTSSQRLNSPGNFLINKHET